MSGVIAKTLHRALMAALLLPLAGCMTDRLATGSVVPDDYHERHPIVLGENATMVDVYPAGQGIDQPTRLRIQDFVADYRQRGRGPVNLLIPRGGHNESYALAASDAIRRELVASGARGGVQVGSYEVLNPDQAAPIRLSFLGLKAAVASKCGEWPADLASGSSAETWENRPYWNFGCSTQQNLAAQVADSRDLAGPRGETPSDVAMRTRAITNVRNGTDPGTSWKTQNTNIGKAGGN